MTLTLIVNNDATDSCQPRRSERVDCASWRRSIRYVDLADHRRLAADCELWIAREEYGEDDPGTRLLEERARLAFELLIEHVRRQILLPAPDVGALRWKEKHCNAGSLANRDPAVREAIERDRQRFSDVIERNRRAAAKRSETCALRARP
ncbi:hypothetical protein [Hansschlegelia sp. KR7-227]|uniref:hypothetical protein n=1 Tax=Hansschlegelia sp. KR7-227 TaxID=3400914 RepID=UPI003C09F47F